MIKSFRFRQFPNASESLNKYQTDLSNEIHRRYHSDNRFAFRVNYRFLHFFTEMFYLNVIREIEKNG